MRLVWLEYYFLSRPMFLAVLELHVAWPHNHQKYWMREKALTRWESGQLAHHNALQRLRSESNL